MRILWGRIVTLNPSSTQLRKAILAILILNCSLLVTFETKPQSSKPLFAAVKNNDITAVKSLIELGANVNIVDDDSDHVLMYAALYTSVDLMELLIKKGANPNSKNNSGETPLMWCTHNKSKVELLLQHGADINAKANSGNTPLLIACIGSEQYDIVRLLLEKGADPLTKNGKKETALIRASLFGDRATISLLLDRGVDINAQDQDGVTALIQAVLNSNKAGALELLNRGADPDIPMSFGLTALSTAVMFNDTETVNAILKKTKNVNAVHADGHTPLMWAAYNEYDNPHVIQALLDKGADVNIKAPDGATALSWALKKGNTETVTLLRKAAAK